MPDWTVGIQIINFLIILWILNLILYRPIRNILRQRKEKIDGLEDDVSKPIMKMPWKKTRPLQRVSKRLGPRA